MDQMTLQLMLVMLMVMVVETARLSVCFLELLGFTRPWDATLTLESSPGCIRWC
jgi:hypothetical protein